MATYAIGDLQGCDAEFVALLEKIDFSNNDRLWLVGDLVNRGPGSLSVLRRIKAMAEQCVIVLGNHDLHFLAMHFGGHKPTRSDTLNELLAAHDVDELAHWLRCQKLVHISSELNCAMVHAGIPHIWSLDQAQSLAREVERVIAGRELSLSYIEFFEQMYGNEPNLWNDSLVGMARFRVITNYFTRMRLVRRTGELDFAHKGALSEAPEGWQPWYEHILVDADRPKLLFGHWAALDGQTGRQDIVALDTGCVWGRKLTALNLDTGDLTTVDAIT